MDLFPHALEARVGHPGGDEMSSHTRKKRAYGAPQVFMAGDLQRMPFPGGDKARGGGN